MRQAAKPTDQGRPPSEHATAGDEPARFLRNLTSLPDADFASTYSPAIHAVLVRYADLPDPRAARRGLILALRAALKRRRAFILPRFTQAEDSWRIRECATYAVAIAILVEHAAAMLAPDRADQTPDLQTWGGILTDPKAPPETAECVSRDALFDAIVPARGRRWIAREPLVRTLIANYFTDTASNELRDIVAPVVAGFGQEREALSHPGDEDSPAPPACVEDQPSDPRPQTRPQFLERALVWVRGVGRHRGRTASQPSLRKEPIVTQCALPEHDATAPPESASTGQGADATPLPMPEASEITARNPPPPLPETAESSPSRQASTDAGARSPRASDALRQRRAPARVADLLDGLPTTPTSTSDVASSTTAPAVAPRRRDIGDHGAAVPRIGHAADYARGLMVENALRPTRQTESFVLSGSAPGATRQPLDIDALFPARRHSTQFDSDAIAAWTAFRSHLVAALRSGAQSANGERSLVHLLDVGVFLVWPHVVLPFGDELRLAPQAIKAAMRASGVLAVNRADRQDDRHAFPALTGDPGFTCRGLVTLPEYLWPDASQRPVSASTFVRPPAIYGQRYRRPH